MTEANHAYSTELFALTNDKLKEKLDAAGIKYEENAVKRDLVRLLVDGTASTEGDKGKPAEGDSALDGEQDANEKLNIEANEREALKKKELEKQEAEDAAAAQNKDASKSVVDEQAAKNADGFAALGTIDGHSTDEAEPDHDEIPAAVFDKIIARVRETLAADNRQFLEQVKEAAKVDRSTDEAGKLAELEKKVDKLLRNADEAATSFGATPMA